MRGIKSQEPKEENQKERVYTIPTTTARKSDWIKNWASGGYFFKGKSKEETENGSKEQAEALVRDKRERNKAFIPPRKTS